MTTHTLCPECGFDVDVDEDGCCVSCGATAVGPGVDAAHALRSLQDTKPAQEAQRMSRNEMLRGYLIAHADNRQRWGWLSRYEEEICPNGQANRHASLHGHYCGMIGDLLQIIGHDRVLVLIDALDSIDRAVAEASKDAD